MDRLFSQFQPEHYDIYWDLRQAKQERVIHGTTSIFGVHSSDEKIMLHAKDLDISSVTVNSKEMSFSMHDDVLTIDCTKSGDTSIDISFSLHLTDAMHGIYPCYFTVNGEKKELYATQFESHHAREAFPCIDEPLAKATFSVSITSNEPVVLSNMPESAKDDKTIGFTKTPRMSTYLVAFVAGDLQHATTKTKNGVEVNVYATPAQPSASLDWALKNAANTIDFFDEYFGVPYPLPKSDHVALPDFSSGAMENWGLITYREVALLADPETTGISTRRYVATVIAHELSHQWFGNLVTMKWWNNLWLNESFATLMEYLATDALYPDWNQWNEFANSEGVAALRRDSIDGVQSVQIDVSTPSEISSLFDGAIVYAKGGRLLRMMQLWIGDDAFRTGLKQYFTKFQYSNTTGDDLWSCLSDASGKDVGELMNAWITQPGYPVVHASLNDDSLTLEQEQFFIGQHEPSLKTWPIPIDANIQGLPEILAKKRISTLFTSSEPLLLNQNNASHFITHYDDTLQSRIISAIADKKLSVSQRCQFLNEQILLARSGIISSSSLIDILESYKDEAEQSVWEMISLAIGDLKKFVENDDVAENKLRDFVANLARKQYERLGWKNKNNESESDSQMRTTIIGCMLYGNDADAIHTAREAYSLTPLPLLNADLRPLIISSVVKNSTDASDIVSELIEEYKSTQSADLRNDIASGVTSVRDKVELSRLINLLTNSDFVRSQDVVSWFVDLMRNKLGREATWQWLQEHWDWIEENFASDKSHDYFPRYAAMLLSTRKQLDEYKSFFLPKRDDQSLTRAIDVGILDLEAKISLVERDSPAVIESLAHRY